MNKLLKWKSALTQASNLSGLDSTKIRPEPKLTKKIVEDIFKKLKRNSSYDLEGLAMGEEIACQANAYKSGIRRRLWKHEDIYQVFKKNEGKEDIHGMSLNLAKIKEIYLRPDAFERMDNLKILKFYKHFGHASRLHISDVLQIFQKS
ncbi:hypothetical protein L6164_001441 [Bauhinia variegata]|uniref:Uncharacterized protein n=1 Tax=Bauhinia variegata TaxID=167791 RepID=A0ACB9QBS3_BAUVA|nr:hypothetical protein L6164_001441 [Bauhinia variegata]